jgi:hypothetical protein
MRLAGRIATLATLVLVLASASQASAAAPRSFYGVMAANDPDASEIARMGAGKVGTLRINFVWGAVQPTEGAAYDWSHYDAIIVAAAQEGIRVLPTVYSSPAWAAKRNNFPPDQAHRNDFRNFVSAAAARYGANGTFWSENPGVPKVPVIWWQFWNEVNSPSFWYPKPSAKQYVGLLRVFHDGITSGDPSAKIALAGLFRTPQVKNGVDLDQFLPAIYRRHAKPLFDAAAIHPYATTPAQALDAVQETRKIMLRFKDRGASLWITEVGWASGGNPTPLTVSPQRQASYLRNVFNLAAKNRGRLHINGLVWYSWRDLPGGVWFDHTGLFTQTFDSKPAWDAFTSLTGGSATDSGTSGPPGPPIPLP